MAPMHGRFWWVFWGTLTILTPKSPPSANYYLINLDNRGVARYLYTWPICDKPCETTIRFGLGKRAVLYVGIETHTHIESLTLNPGRGFVSCLHPWKHPQPNSIWTENGFRKTDGDSRMVILQHTVAWMWMKAREVPVQTRGWTLGPPFGDLRAGWMKFGYYSSSWRFRWMKTLPQPAWSLRGGTR